MPVFVDKILVQYGSRPLLFSNFLRNKDVLSVGISKYKDIGDLYVSTTISPPSGIGFAALHKLVSATDRKKQLLIVRVDFPHRSSLKVPSHWLDPGASVEEVLSLEGAYYILEKYLQIQRSAVIKFELLNALKMNLTDKLALDKENYRS